MQNQEAPRWLMINAAEFDNKPGNHRNALVLARPIEGVVLLPKPRKVRLRIQEVLQAQPEDEAGGENKAPTGNVQEAPTPSKAAPQ